MIIASALLAAAVADTAQTGAAPVTPATSGPVVVLETSLGDIRIALDEAKAPVTVKNFLTYVRAGHYDGTIFHRVIPNFMIQGGGMDGLMTEKPTRAPIKNEAANKLRNDRGTIAMARTADPNSATSQFFINVKNNASLDYGVGGAGYAVFGNVVGGMDVVDRIVNVPTTSKGPHQNVPITPVLIKHARVEGAPRPKPADASGVDKTEPSQHESTKPEAAPTKPEPTRPEPARPASMPRRN
jgi:peptidyl-prolyl cis-trans isomerase A (cyclophilin A)